MAGTSSRGRLLIVDDEEMLARVMARRLSARGFEVEVQHSGRAALQALSFGVPFDLVLLDVMMPGMSGIDVLKQIRRHTGPADLPVVMLTSRSDTNTVVLALQSGANDYVTKPAEMDVLLARVLGQLDRKRADSALRRSEERYALAARGAKDVLWDWDVPQGEIYLSEGSDGLFGLEGAGPFTRAAGDLHKVLHPDDHDRMQNAVRALLQGHTERLAVEARFRSSKIGDWVWVLVRGAAVRNSQGLVTRAAGSISDLSTPSLHDRRTGLPNRTLLLEQVRTELGRGTGGLPTVMVISLERAEHIATTLGGEASDLLAEQTARRLQSVLAALAAQGGIGAPLAESLCRIVGFQFALLVHPSATPAMTLRLGGTLRAALCETFVLAGTEVRCGAAVGIAQGPADLGPQDLLGHALSALTRARTLPGGVAVFSEEAHQEAIDRLSLETDLAGAIDRGELHLEYQPIVELGSEEPIAFEALCRWVHPVHGRVPPDVFIPLAESTGLASQLGAWVLHRACTDVLPWHTAAGKPVRICVNVSPLQFLEGDLCETITTTLQSVGLAPERLEIELTEGVFAREPDLIQSVMASLRYLGVRVALDDFGTGYSSLAYLVKFPLDTLKLDRSFVSTLPGDERSEAITRATLALAHELGLEVVAEGIEEKEQAAFLTDLRCEFGQGWHFGRPSRAENWDPLLTVPRTAAR